MESEMIMRTFDFCLVLHEKWTRFSQSDARNFFMYIITRR